MDGDPPVRRSAGMRGDPRAPEERPFSNIPKAAPQAPQPARPPLSRHPRPSVLMGEVAAPRGEESGAESARRRQALRAFMAARRLSPSQWSRDAGVPVGELMSFLTGRSRELPGGTARRLAQAAGAAPEELFA